MSARYATVGRGPVESGHASVESGRTPVESGRTPVALSTGREGRP